MPDNVGMACAFRKSLLLFPLMPSVRNRRAADWITKTGTAALADALGVSRHAVNGWLRYFRGAPASRNAFPPSFPQAARMVRLSGNTVSLADFRPAERFLLTMAEK